MLINLSDINLESQAKVDKPPLKGAVNRNSLANNPLFAPVNISVGGWVVILIAISVIVGVVINIFAPKPEVPLPNLSITQNSELPGEKIIRGSSSDTELEATVTDHIDAKDEDGWRYVGSNNIWIHFDNDRAGDSSANLVTTIIQEGEEPQVRKKTLSPSIVVEDLPYGETKFTLIAENTAGRVEKTLTVTKITHRAACDADPANKTHAYCSHFYKTEDKPALTLPTHSSSGNSGASSGCVHYEAGQCWDEIDDEAYESGRWDKDFGHYGGGYNPPEDCTGICADIYDEAYTEGYEE